MKKALLTKLMLLLCALIAGSSSVWAVEQVYYTLTPSAGSSSVYAEAEDITVTDGSIGISWNVTGNSSLTPWRIGGKSLTNTDRAVYSKTAMAETITKISLSIGAASNVTINSVTLIVSTAANGAGEQLDEVSITTGLGANKTLNFTPTTPLTSWAKNSYYKFVFNITISSTSNKYLEFSSAVFNYNYVPSAPLSSITLSGTYPKEFVKGSEFSHKGMTVTATYDDASELDVTSYASFTGYDMNTAGDQEVTVSYTEGVVTKTASYNIKIIEPVVTLDLSSNTGWSFPTSKKEIENTYTKNGYSITLQGSDGAGYYFDTNNLLLGKTGATLTLPAFGFKVSKILVYGTDGSSATVTFNVFDGADAVSTQVTSSKVTQTFNIDAEHQAVGKVYTLKITNNNNMRITKIEVYGNGCEAGVVTSFGWATYIATADMEFPTGRAYVVTDASVGNTITKAEVTQVPAGTPVLLKNEGAVTAQLLDATPAAPASNMLSISNGTIPNGKYAYVLAKDGTKAGFKQWTGDAATLNGRVVMLLDQAVNSPFFLLDGETTAIKSIDFKNVEREVYDLQGRKVVQPTRGLYIVNGKKYVVK